MKYYLVAGEASGDLHGANLIKALKSRDNDAVFEYFGGDLMLAEGGTLKKHYAEMAFMGFLEVVLNLRKIAKNLADCKRDILAFNPDVVILIDFPGFNMRIAEFASKQNIKVFYYISPKVWAWNQKRVLKIKKYVNRMFCILPFEVDFYKKWGMEVDYIGNPLLDAVAAFTPDENFKKENSLSAKPIIALLPGSRKQEIERVLPQMLAAAKLFPNHQFLIAGAPGFNKAYYQQFDIGEQTTILYHQTYNILACADAALVTSGTATLETAIFKVPQVVLYKGNTISIAIARMLVSIKYISLVNLILNKKAVTELIQEDCNETKISVNLKEILSGPSREKMLEDYMLLQQVMGKAGASSKAAGLMVNYLLNTAST